MGGRGSTSTGGAETYSDYTGADFAEQAAYFDKARHWDALTPEEQRSARKYAGDDFFMFNEPLREGTVPSRAMQKHIQTLKNAIEKSSLPENLTVLREIGSPPEAIRNVQEGSIFEDKGFVSTTIRGQGILNNEGTVFRIRAKKGTKALEIGTNGRFGYETEVLFPPGSRFRVSKITRRTAETGGEQTLIDADVI